MDAENLEYAQDLCVACEYWTALAFGEYGMAAELPLRSFLGFALQHAFGVLRVELLSVRATRDARCDLVPEPPLPICDRDAERFFRALFDREQQVLQL